VKPVIFCNFQLVSSSFVKIFKLSYISMHILSCQTSNCECMTVYIIDIIDDKLITDDKYAIKCCI